jgi:asparagine synthase (glutamine-hydrolysing)
MCGIAGFVSPRAEVDGKALLRMTEIIRYRGPDDAGHAIFTKDRGAPVLDVSANDNIVGNVGLGHRRLSIVDLSPLGHQPMSYADGRYWLTYNGEVYNYLELRGELEALGHSFVSETDSEVILAAYSQWGADCLQRFNGMWAFAIYDSHEGKIFLARDRFGIKPLYYWRSPQGDFFFGSEIKQFTVLDGWKAVMNPQRCYDFLIWGLSDHTNETMFDGVMQLRPGHYITMNANSSEMHIVQWYKLLRRPTNNTDDNAAKEFHHLLNDSVRLQLRADVPVGSCLSGGLDSSSIVCLMSQQLAGRTQQKTFSATASVEKYNERQWIDAVVEKTGVQPHFVEPSLGALYDVAEKITWHQDEPFGSTSIYAQWNVFELAAKNDVTVMLDGQGADEQLGGYHGFFAPLFYALLKSGRWGELVCEMIAVKKLHGYSYKRSAEGVLNMMLPDFIKNPLRRIFGKCQKLPDWLNIQKLGANPVDPNHILGSYTDSIASLSQAQLTASNLQMLLHWEDRNSMAHSIESRVPFLDHRLVEYSLSLKNKDKISGGMTKLVLRRAMNGILPDKIRDRVDKLGFATPEEVWLREKGTALFRQKLEDAVRNLDGIVKHDVMQYFEDVVSGRKAFSFVFWRIINFAQWVKLFNVQKVRMEV